MAATTTMSFRRGMFAIAGVVVPMLIDSFVVSLGSGTFLLLYVLIQSIAVLDFIFLLVGRFFPSAVLVAYRLEEWLGPWTKK